MGPRLLALLVLVVALAPGADAQLPPVCGPIRVTFTTPTVVAPGGTGDVAFTLRNDGNADAVVDLSVVTPTAGWNVVPPQNRTIALPRGGSAGVNFTFAAAAHATEDATVTYQGAGTCAPAGLPTGCPPGACETTIPPDSFVLAVQRPGGFRFPGLSTDFPLEYLAAGILLVGVAVAIPLLLRRRGPANAIASCPEPLKAVRPGHGTSFPIELRNPSDATTRLGLQVGPVPEGWSAFLPLPEVQLAARETRGLWLMVRAPPDARSGDAAEVEITATDAARPGRPHAFRVRAEVHPNAPESG